MLKDVDKDCSAARTAALQPIPKVPGVGIGPQQNAVVQQAEVLCTINQSIEAVHGSIRYMW
ncbi:MAG: hypothetical protein RhofKO_04020 [Rhodothermales bacterium]